MPNWIWVGIFAILFAVTAAWVARRLLDTDVGWLRAVITAVVVFFLSLPLVIWTLTEADVYENGRIVVSGPVAVSFLALTIGWMFAAVLVAVITLEFLWPSRGVANPITVVREALRRRDRARRYAQIVAIGSRHGLGFYEGHRRGAADLPTALVSAMNDAGVTFVKLGQVLSSRDDVLPRDVIEALATLQMDSTPIPWAEAETAITEQLGRPISEVFAEIDVTPLAAASVAQVHVARLLTGEEVVVKIQRPKARAEVTTDLDILDRLSIDAERRTGWAKEYGVRALATEFARALREELDYRIEASNTEMLRGAIAKNPSILRVPKVYRELSTAQMIVQERAPGIPLSRLQPGALPPERALAIANALLDAIVDQIAVRGVFHADLHPGNVILDEDDTLTLIDFGAVGVVEHSMRRMLIPLLIGMANDDDVAVTDVVLLLCTPMRTPGSEAAPFDTSALQHDIGVILTRVHNTGMDENIFRLLVDVLRRNRLALPPSLLLIFRTLASLEGTLRKLVPGYDMVGRALEVVPGMALQMFSPREALLSAQTWSALITEQFRRMPRRVESITRSLDDGTLSVRLRAFEGERERGWVDALFGRITTTVVGITLIVTGIMLGVADGGPMLTGNVPAFAFLGSVMGLGGLLLLLRSLRTAFHRT